MSIINEVRLENFRQYRGKHSIKFAKKLNLIIGENDAGKTGIFLAILFGLYKHSGRNKSPKAYISYGENSMEVKVDYTSLATNDRYRVTRDINGSSIGFIFEKFNPGTEKWDLVLAKTTGTKEEDLNKKVEETIGLTKKSFLNIVYTEQKRFYDIIFGGSQVKDNLDNILGIKASIFLEQALKNIIKKFQDEIKLKTNLDTQLTLDTEEKRKIESGLGEKEEEYNKLENSINEVTKRYESTELIYNIVSKIDSKELLEAHNSIIYDKEEIKNANTELERIQNELGRYSEIEKKVKELSEKKEEYKTEINSFRNNVIEEEKSISGLEQNIEQKEKIINTMKKTSGLAKCPTCQQEVSKEHLKNEIEKYKKEVTELRNNLTDKNRRIESIKVKLSKGEEVFDSIDSGLQRLNEKSSQFSYYNNTIKKFEEKIIDNTKSINVMYENITNIFDPIIKSKKIRDEIRNTLKSLDSKYSADSFNKNYDILVGLNQDVNNEYIKYKTTLSELNKSKGSKDKDLQFLKDMIKKKKQSIQNINKQLDKIKNIEKNIQRFLKEQVVIGKLSDEIRDLKLKELGKRTYYWYKKLISNVKYKNVVIDKENYELKVIPISDDKDNEYSSRTNVGGGNETILALAERIALVELFNYRGIIMLDEPTDAMDSENINTFIEGISRLTDEIPQLFLITHHNIGVPHANNVIKVKVDNEKRSSFIS